MTLKNNFPFFLFSCACPGVKSKIRGNILHIHNPALSRRQSFARKCSQLLPLTIVFQLMLIIGDPLLFGLILHMCGLGKINREGMKRWPFGLPCLQSACSKSQSQLQGFGSVHSAPLGCSTLIRGKSEEYSHCHRWAQFTKRVTFRVALTVLQTEEESQVFEFVETI